MTIGEKLFHSFILSILFSLICWFIIDKIIIEISVIKYFFIEILLIVSLKLFNFTKVKLRLD